MRWLSRFALLTASWSVGAACDPPFEIPDATPTDSTVFTDASATETASEVGTIETSIDVPAPDAPALDAPTTQGCDGGLTRCGALCLDLQNDPTSCGTCDRECVGGSGAMPICERGRCSIECRTGFANCDTNTANGCETNLSESAQNCGRCGQTCPPPPNGTARCASSRCVVACNTNYGDCDSDAANGCEVDLRASDLHCGACGRACGTGRSCQQGLCCLTTERNCGGTCVDVRNSATHCGACDQPCLNGFCSSGACQCIGGRTSCGGRCVFLDNNVEHCGRCGNICQANQVCVGGECLLDCSGAQPHRCPQRGLPPGNYVCVNLANDPNYCGFCDRACSAGQSCVCSVCR